MDHELTLTPGEQSGAWNASCSCGWSASGTANDVADDESDGAFDTGFDGDESSVDTLTSLALQHQAHTAAP